MIYAQTGQRVIRDGLGHAARPLDHGEINDAAQQTSRDTRRATGAFGDLARACLIGGGTHQAGATGHNLVQLILGIEFKSRGDAKPVA